MFIKNLASLMTGSLLAQAIPLMALPILTRMYNPEDFGLLALYAAMASILSVVATARYEQAVMLPKVQSDALALVKVSIIVTALLSIFCLILILLFGEMFAEFLDNKSIYKWLYLLPISTLLAGCNQTFIIWHHRKQQFKVSAISRVTHATSQSVIQLSASPFSALGLVLGQLFGSCMAFVVLLFNFDRNYIRLIWGIPLADCKKQVFKYKKFPLYGMWGAISDTTAAQMPIFLITKYFDTGVLGFYSLTFKVLNLPLSIISSALSQLLFQKVTEISRTSPKELSAFILKIAIGLIIVFLPVVFVIFMWAEELFSFVFGNKWVVAGEYAKILIIAIAVRFVVSPLSAVMVQEENLKLGAAWQILYLITIFTTLMIFVGSSIEVFLYAFVVHEIVLYLIYFLLIYYSALNLGK